MIEFLVQEWISNHYFKFYVTSKDTLILSNGKEQVEELRTVQEEADTPESFFICFMHFEQVSCSFT